MEIAGLTFWTSTMALGAWLMYIRWHRPWMFWTVGACACASVAFSSIGAWRPDDSMSDVAILVSGSRVAAADFERFEPKTSNLAVGNSSFEPVDSNVEPAKTSKVYASSVSDSGLYHRAKCRYSRQMAPKYTIEFESTEQAESAGYSPCKWCNE